VRGVFPGAAPAGWRSRSKQRGSIPVRTTWRCSSGDRRRGSRTSWRGGH
jgi:hypothetical protein